jgi:hypothetical protein
LGDRISINTAVFRLRFLFILRGRLCSKTGYSNEMVITMRVSPNYCQSVEFLKAFLDAVSTWKERYCDKEFLYHLAMTP